MEDRVSTFWLRLLIGWWMVPVTLLVARPVIWLVSGDWDEAGEIIDTFWNGRL